MTESDPAGPQARGRPPWTVIVAAVIPPLYFFPIAVLLIAQGETEDLGDFTGIGTFVLVLGALELFLSFGIWSGRKGVWRTTVVLRVLVVVALIVGNLVELPLVFMTAACWIIPAVLSFVFLVLERSRKWCGVE